MLTTMTEEDWTICFGGIRGISLTARRQGTERAEVSRSPAVFRGSQHHLAGAPGKVWALEPCLETFWRLSRSGTFEAFFDALAAMTATAHLVQMFNSTVVRAPRLGSGRKRGQHDQALGRSRGGFSTKNSLED